MFFYQYMCTAAEMCRVRMCYHEFGNHARRAYEHPMYYRIRSGNSLLRTKPTLASVSVFILLRILVTFLNLSGIHRYYWVRSLVDYPCFHAELRHLGVKRGVLSLRLLSRGLLTTLALCGKV
jgi:hypothetical protein